MSPSSRRPRCAPTKPFVVFSAGKPGILWKLDRKTGKYLAHKEMVLQNAYESFNATTGEPHYRNDIVEINYTIQREPNQPVHIRINDRAEVPLRVIESIKDKDGNVTTRIETRRVETGLMAAGQVEIKEGLVEGDIVVARAGALLREGDPVRPVTMAAETK